jgi:uncharacterized protein (TIGR02598 family)
VRKQPTSAFSLVEVVLAIGLVSFALVAILAFFPNGLVSNRSSVEETRAAQISRAITGTIDSQCSAFSGVKCYGLNLDLSSLNTMAETTASNVLYASYPTPNQPVISSTPTSDSIYTIEMRFDNNPSLTPAGTKLGSGKVSLIQIRVFGKAHAGGAVQFFYLARNKA